MTSEAMHDVDVVGGEVFVGGVGEVAEVVVCNSMHWRTLILMARSAEYMTE